MTAPAPPSVQSTPSEAELVVRMNEHFQAFWDLAQQVGPGLNVRGAAFTATGRPVIMIDNRNPPLVEIVRSVAAPPAPVPA